jgi:hypothetical protein
MNLLIYLIPFMFGTAPPLPSLILRTVDVVLSKVKVSNLQTLFVAIYIAIYLIPVGYVVVHKLKVASPSPCSAFSLLTSLDLSCLSQTAAATHLIEEGTFCFRPARSIRWSWPNAFAIQGFVLEFIQHCTYVFPLGRLLSPLSPHSSLPLQASSRRRRRPQ